MGNFNKVISLSQASKLSGYHSDYLSALIRKGEIKGQKIAGNWFTTEEEIKEYIFKQKIRRKKLAVGEFLSQKRTRNIFIFSAIFFLCLILAGMYLYGKNAKIILEEGSKTLSPDIEIID